MYILLDMDEVICDFTGGACKAHGWTREQLEEKREPGQWNIAEVMGLTDDQFWEPINEMGSAFWYYLQFLPWTWDLIDLLNDCGRPWYILSSPSLSPDSWYGKAHWIQRYLGTPYFTRLILTNNKDLLAKPDALLIDDRQENGTKFMGAGGGGFILFPSKGNELYPYADDPVGYISQFPALKPGA